MDIDHIKVCVWILNHLLSPCVYISFQIRQKKQNDLSAQRCTDQTGHPPNLISLLCVLSGKLRTPTFFKGTVKSYQTGWMPRQIWVWSESSLGAQVILLVLSCFGSISAPGKNCQENIPHGKVPYRSWLTSGYYMEMKCDPLYRPQALAVEQAHTFTCIDGRWVLKTTMYDPRITADTVCVPGRVQRTLVKVNEHFKW